MQRKALSLLTTVALVLTFAASIRAQGYEGSNWTDHFLTTDFIDFDRTDNPNIIVDTRNPGLIYLSPGRTGRLDDGTNEPGRRFFDRIDRPNSRNVVIYGDDVTGGDYIELLNRGEYYEEFKTFNFREAGLTTAEWDTSDTGELRVPEDDRWFIDALDLDQGFRLRDVFFADESNGWIVGEGGAIWKTTDKGTTWSRVIPSDPIMGVSDLLAVNFVGVQNGWVVGKQGRVWQTSNAGQTWQQIQSPQFFGNRDLNDVCYIRTNNQFEGWIVANDGRIWHQTVNGNWEEQTVNNVDSNLNHIFIFDKEGVRAGYAVGDFNTYLEYDFSTNKWSQPNVTGFPNQAQDMNSVFFFESDLGWIVGTSGTVLRTRNAGASWSDLRPSGIENLEVTDIFFITKDIGYLVTRTGRMYKTTNGTAINDPVAWRFQEAHKANGDVDPTFNRDLHAIFFPNHGSGWAVGDRAARLHNPYYWANTDFFAVSKKVNSTFFNPDLKVRKVFFDARYDMAECGANECVAQASISVDGGANWRDIDPNEEITLAVPGNDLRWRMKLRTNNSNVTPRVEWLRLIYTTEYDTLNGGLFTALPENTSSQTGYPDKNKSFTNIQWLVKIVSNTRVRFQFAIDDGPWTDAPADGQPIADADKGTFLFTSTLPAGTAGKALRYRAFLDTDDPAASPRLLEVRMGYGYVPHGQATSSKIIKLDPQGEWDELTFSGNRPFGTNRNIDVLHTSGEAVLDGDITVTPFSMSGKNYSLFEELRLRVDLFSNNERTLTPELDMWHLRWGGVPTPGLIFFATQDADMLFPKVYKGNELIYLKLEDDDRNVNRSLRDEIPAGDVTLTSKKTGDRENVGLLELSLNVGLFSNTPDKGVPMLLVSSRNLADAPGSRILSVMPNDTLLVFYHDSVNGDSNTDEAYVSNATPSTLMFVDAAGASRDTFNISIPDDSIQDENIYILVSDPDENTNSNTSEHISVTVFNMDLPAEFELLTCDEYPNPNSGKFRCGLASTNEGGAVSNDNKLFAEDLDRIRAVYRDKDAAPVDSSSDTAVMKLPPSFEPTDEPFDNLIIAPNPHYDTDPDVIIRFDVDEDFEHAEVHIYNIAGEWVDEVTNDDFTKFAPHPTRANALVWQAEWNLRNHADNPVASGTYFLHVIGRHKTKGTKEQTVKLLVIHASRPN